MNNQTKCYLCGNVIKANFGNSTACDNCFKSLEAGTYKSIQRDTPKPKENNSNITTTSTNRKFSKLFFEYIGTVGGLLTILLAAYNFYYVTKRRKEFKRFFYICGDYIWVSCF